MMRKRPAGKKERKEKERKRKSSVEEKRQH